MSLSNSDDEFSPLLWVKKLSICLRRTILLLCSEEDQDEEVVVETTSSSTSVPEMIGGFKKSTSVDTINWKISDENVVESVLKSQCIALDESFLNEMLWNVVCVVAVDDVSSKKTSGGTDLQLLYEAAVTDTIANLKKKESAKWNDRLFRFLPNGNWPESFVDFIEDKKLAEPSKQFKEKNAGKTSFMIKSLW